MSNNLKLILVINLLVSFSVATILSFNTMVKITMGLFQ